MLKVASSVFRNLCWKPSKARIKWEKSPLAYVFLGPQLSLKIPFMQQNITSRVAQISLAGCSWKCLALCGQKNWLNIEKQMKHNLSLNIILTLVIVYSVKMKNPQQSWKPKETYIQQLWIIKHSFLAFYVDDKHALYFFYKSLCTQHGHYYFNTNKAVFDEYWFRYGAGCWITQAKETKK